MADNEATPATTVRHDKLEKLARTIKAHDPITFGPGAPFEYRQLATIINALRDQALDALGEKD